MVLSFNLPKPTKGLDALSLSTYEKEYLAMLMAVEQWHSYLKLAKFQILIDHKSLVQLEEQ
jgi:hypothetical protein